MFSKLRPLLFKIDPEKAHNLAIQSLKFNLVSNVFDETKNDPIFHATIFNKNTPHLQLANNLKSIGHKVVLVDYQPTSEMLVIDFAKKIKKRLPGDIQLFSLKLQETATCFAEWYASDN